MKPPAAGVTGWTESLLAFSVVGVVPLLTSVGFSEPFTVPKRLALSLLVGLWLVVSAGSGPPRPRRERWPSPLTVGLGMLLAAWAWDAYRQGLLWTLEPLLSRALLLLLAVCFARRLRARDGTDDAVLLGAATAVLVSLGWGVGATAVGEPGPETIGERLAGPFGNANLAAEYLGFCALVLLLGMQARRGALGFAMAALAGAAAGYVAALGSRSALLALAFGGICALGVRRPSRRQAIVVAAAALLTPVLALGLASAREAPDGASGVWPLTERAKLHSTQQRWRLWTNTGRLIADRPAGVGLGQFEHAIAPYFAGDEEFGRIRFRSPHDELLRLLAEHGLLVGAGVTACLLLSLARRLRWGPHDPGARAATALVAYALVQAAFQFPLETATGVTVCAFSLGHLLARADAAPAPAAQETRHPATPWAWRLAALGAAGALVTGQARLARADWLHGRYPADARQQARACRLDPTLLPACVSAAYLEARAGRVECARSRLHEVLVRSPHYPPAIKLLGEVRVAGGGEAEGCAYLRLYDGLIGGDSEVRGRIESECPPAPGPARAGDLVPRYERFPFAAQDPGRAGCDHGSRPSSWAVGAPALVPHPETP